MTPTQFRERVRWAVAWRAAAFRARADGARRRLDWALRRTARGHGLGREVVVSLTSYPPRFGCLGATLRSILSQRVRPDRVVLWLAPDDMRSLPADVLALERHGLEIRPAPDTRSYKKVIPALAAFPDAFLVTADDDAWYPPGWLGDLVAASGGRPGLVVCHRAHAIELGSDGLPLPYRRWRLNVGASGPSVMLFPTGSGGVLYPPGTFPPEVMDEGAFMAACPQGDDIWLYWMGRMNGATYLSVGDGRDFPSWPGSQDVALWLSNVEADANDEQISRMVGRYGFPGREPVSRAA